MTTTTRMTRTPAGLVRRRTTLIVGAALLALCAAGLPAANADTDQADAAGEEQAAQAVVAAGAGASEDAAAIAQAASAFDPDDAASAAGLVDAASAATAVPLEGSADNAVALPGVVDSVTVRASGAGASITSADGMKLAVTAAGDDSRADVVGGVAVAQDVTDGVDVVTRAVPDGAQLVAILDDENAPTSLDFDLDLPEGASLEPQDDGSINVVMPTEVESEDPTDAARFDAQVDAILGDAETQASIDELTVDEITDEQWVALEALDPVQTDTETVDLPVATIGAAWATDANGTPLETRYQLDGTTLTQQITTTANTAYPVTADPSAWWWVRTSAMCAGQIAIALVPGAKAARILAKAKNFVNKSAKMRAAVAKLGGVRATLSKVKQYIVNKNKLSAANRKRVKALFGLGFDSVLDFLGFGSCGSIVRQIV
ncbi:hypothetical protein [Isoptericola sp. NPDC057191]|uniref:hypothetical protein n=1 Tax=Isoptericola sp. NPDC057191 TaxID=3346041 RepID=UPI0036417031